MVIMFEISVIDHLLIFIDIAVNGIYIITLTEMIYECLMMR